MDLRTDLALEKSESFGGRLPDGVTCETQRTGNLTLHRIAIRTPDAAAAMGKPIGRYITIETPPFKRNAALPDADVAVLAKELQTLLPPSGTILVAGLGNEQITPDALGPKCSALVLATRHICGELAASAGLGDLRAVVNLIPGVLGRTGIETGELLRGAVQTVQPAAVVTVDALAARRLSRLGCTIQMADTGVSPGSGVGNARAALTEESLGVPVIALGVPTVVDAATLVEDLSEDPPDSTIRREGADMMITPREIDLVIERAAQLLALTINHALQPHLSVEEILQLVS